MVALAKRATLEFKQAVSAFDGPTKGRMESALRDAAAAAQQGGGKPGAPGAARQGGGHQHLA